VSSTNDGAPTDLYLVRIWRRMSAAGALDFHGKLQHVVSGASCYFDELSALPEALETMMEQGAPSGNHEVGESPIS
jgi:hypothetical protein